MIEEARSQRLHQMEQETGCTRHRQAASLAKIPDYDNVQNVVASSERSAQRFRRGKPGFSPVTSPAISPAATWTCSFTCGAMRRQRALSQLSGAPYRSQITGLTLVSDGETASLPPVICPPTMTITFFEYTRKPLLKKPPPKPLF